MVQRRRRKGAVLTRKANGGGEGLKSRCQCMCTRLKGARYVCVLERLIGAEGDTCLKEIMQRSSLVALSVPLLCRP